MLLYVKYVFLREKAALVVFVCCPAVSNNDGLLASDGSVVTLHMSIKYFGRIHTTTHAHTNKLFNTYLHTHTHISTNATVQIKQHGNKLRNIYSKTHAKMCRADPGGYCEKLKKSRHSVVPFKLLLAPLC